MMQPSKDDPTQIAAMQTILDPSGRIADGYDSGLSDDDLLHYYRSMKLVRAFDDICLKLQRSGRIGFSIPNLGIEACQIGAASGMRKDDWFFPSYRDFGMALYHGVKPVDMMHNMFGNSLDSAKGRQMPVHFSFTDPIKFASISSPLGTQLPQAVGAAHAAKLRGEDTVALASFGDGGTSTTGFHSALTFAGVWKSPVVFLCQNNGYAISLPAHEQTASDGYAIKGLAYGVRAITVDGNDVFAVREATLEAAAYARAGDGPTLIEAVTFRMGGHSTSDDPSTYVPKEVVEEWAQKDPIDRFEKYLGTRGLWDAEKGVQIGADCLAEIDAAAKVAAATAPPKLETIFSDVYAEIPAHIRKQGEASFELANRLGEAASGDGAFPL